MERLSNKKEETTISRNEWEHKTMKVKIQFDAVAVDQVLMSGAGASIPTWDIKQKPQPCRAEANKKHFCRKPGPEVFLLSPQPREMGRKLNWLDNLGDNFSACYPWITRIQTSLTTSNLSPTKSLMLPESHIGGTI